MKKGFLRLFSCLLCVITVLCSVPVSTAQAVSKTSVTLDFTDENNIGYITAAQSTAVSYSADENAAMIRCLGGVDPQVTVDVSAMADVSADTYKYVVLVFRTPTSNSASANMTELFFCVGDKTYPTAERMEQLAVQNTYNYRYQIIDMSAKSYWTGKVHSVRLDPFGQAEDWDAFFLAAVAFADSIPTAANIGTTNQRVASGYTADISESVLATDKYDLATYTEPYWEGNVVYNESYFPLENADKTISDRTLMYDIDRIVSVKNSALDIEYKYGRDYTVVDGKLHIVKGGNIPTIAYTDYKRQNASGSAWFQCRDGSYTYCTENGYFHKAQIFITYTHSDEWKSSVPESLIDTLSRTYSKLAAKRHVSTVFFGDSITVGCSASGIDYLQLEPRMPLYPNMTVAALKAKYGYNSISLVNTAVGGTTSQWGVETVQDNVISYTPDLVVLAFGMNDGTGGVPAAQYKANIKSMIDAIRTKIPYCEFVLVAPMLANPASLFSGLQADYLPVLRQLSKEYSGVAVVDITTPYRRILDRKIYADITGNNINHPNDFIIRLYAQSIIKALSPYDIEPVREEKLAELYTLANPDSYRAEERELLSQIIAKWAESIENAMTVTEVNNCLSSAKSEIAELKTNAQYEAELLDYTKLRFNSEATRTTIKSYHAAESSLERVGEHDMVKIVSTASDPYFRINYDGKNISADKYKYITLVYYVPEGMPNATASEVFFTAGPNTRESQAMSEAFYLTKGTYECKIFDMSEKTYWTGDIHNIRIDPFAINGAGDEMYLGALVLSETMSDALFSADQEIRILNSLPMPDISVAYDGTNTDTAAADTLNMLTADVNCDGYLNALDSHILKSYLGGKNVAVSPLADVNSDGSINTIDAHLLVSGLAGKTDLGYTDIASAVVSYKDGILISPRGLPETSATLGFKNAEWRDVTVLDASANKEISVCVTVLSADGEALFETDVIISDSPVLIDMSKVENKSDIGAVRLSYASDATVCIRGITFTENID